MASILVVEDDVEVAEGVSDRLAAEGHVVTMVHEGQSALKQAREGGIDLIILDINLPGRLSGFDICRKLREEGSKVLILMLTARRSELDRVKGLDLGADDYILKPFSVSELQAKVRAFLRRAGVGGKPVTRIRLGGVEVDFEAREARADGEAIHLTRKAFGVLHALAKRVDRVVTREVLLAEVWGYEVSAPETRVVDMVVTELREKIEPEPKTPRYLLTVYGEGYKLVSG
jgi:DNA-binding response OmpR family regulator